MIFGNQQILTSIHKLVQTDQQILSMSQLIHFEWSNLAKSILTIPIKAVEILIRTEQILTMSQNLLTWTNISQAVRIVW